MKEKNLQSKFTEWTRKNPPPVTTVYELKMSKGKSIPFGDVKEHQIMALTYASTGQGLFHKIADTPVSWMGGTRMRFGKPKPFDCVYVVNAEAYIVVCFYKPRRKKECIFIDPIRWETERRSSDRKSLTEDRARAISSKVEFI